MTVLSRDGGRPLKKRRIRFGAIQPNQGLCVFPEAWAGTRLHEYMIRIHRPSG